MLSLPDFREKQILFVSGSDISNNCLSFKNENILLKRDGETINQLSCHKTIVMFVIGDCTVTSVLLRKASEYGVSVFLLKDNFQCYARVVSLASGNVLLRSRQYAASAEDDLITAREIVRNKIENQKNLLEKRGISTHGIQRQLSSLNDNEVIRDATLRGIEGSASREFYQEYLRPLNWRRRMPRTKTDPANVLLDIGYTFLFNLTDSILSLFGFDTYKGVYHKLFFQRRSLACDLMEPMRCIIDRQLLKSYNLQQVNEKDFFCKKDVWSLSYANQRKYTEIFAGALMERKEDVFVYLRDYYYSTLNHSGEMPRFKI